MPKLHCAVTLFLLTISAPLLVAQQLTSSTYLNASFSPVAIATSSSGEIYIAGNTVLDSLTGRQGVLVVKLNPQATGYVYEAYLNGSIDEFAGGIAIDNTGNAYITGTTSSADFPVTPGGELTTPASGSNDTRPFVVKLDPNGVVELSCIFGGPGVGEGVAIASDGNIIVTGASSADGFPSTPGAYRVSHTKDRPIIVKLDSNTPKVLFSATGIGGSLIALDSSDNIFVSGQTLQSDFPTTPGAYQTQFANNFTCSGLCQIVFPSPNQYVSKIDPAGSKLVYSTFLDAPPGDSVSFPLAANPNAIPKLTAGLAVDNAGNAYVTGVTSFSSYPFNKSLPRRLIPAPFVSKLDASGSKLLFSVPAGGAGLQLDGLGNLYTAGILYGQVSSPDFPGNSVPVPFPSQDLHAFGLPGNFPSQCLPNNTTSVSEGYLQQMDPSTGEIRSVQLLDASMIGTAAIALGSPAGIWITGAVSRPDVPFTPRSLFQQGMGPLTQAGSYLASVSFAQPAVAGPHIACVLDAATMLHVGVVAPKQLLTVMGWNLGPTKGVSAPAGGATSLGGVSVTFDQAPVKLLYASSSQINLAVPALSQDELPSVLQLTTLMQVEVNGTSSAERLFPVTSSNPALFANLFIGPVNCGGFQGSGLPALVAGNSDGSINSCTHPSKPGSIVSLFVNGVGFGTPPAPGFAFAIFDWDVVIGGASAEVTSVTAENAWVTRVDVRLPADLPLPPGSTSTVNVTMRESGLPVAPLSLTPILEPGLPAGTPLPLALWVRP